MRRITVKHESGPGGKTIESLAVNWGIYWGGVVNFGRALVNSKAGDYGNGPYPIEKVFEDHRICNIHTAKCKCILLYKFQHHEHHSFFTR